MRILSFLFLILLFAACGGTPNVTEHQQSPEEAVKAFFQALSNNEFDKAAALGTEATQKQVAFYRTELSMVQDNPEERKELEARFKLDFKKLECEERQGTMTCIICCNTAGGEATVELHQKDKLWLVDTELGNYKPNEEAE